MSVLAVGTDLIVMNALACLRGRVLGPNGSSCAGAVVVTIAGGQAVTGSDGESRLEDFA